MGTAGYTAALSVLALLDHGIVADAGTVLVTGATGGVGSMAVAMLAGLGFTVAAGSGKADAEPFLRGLGAREVIDRDELTDVSKPLQSGVVGRGRPGRGRHAGPRAGPLAPFGAVAASGNVGGADLPTTVLPFILRGVTLYGIDSARHPDRAPPRGVGAHRHRSEARRARRHGAGRRPRRRSRARSTRSAVAA